LKRKYRVLVVDDEAGFCDFIGHYLTAQGFEVEAASRASQALDMIGRQPYDIVLSDVMMPSLDGLKLLRQIKAVKPQTQVILMTAYASLDKALKAIIYDAADLLIKPFELPALLEAINRALDRRQHDGASTAAGDEIPEGPDRSR
jgi:DNA-binding NtrC family response regulator